MSPINPRVTAAAARVALFYAAFVALEVVIVFTALGRDFSPMFRFIPVAAVALATPLFFGAFLLLVVARRLGLVASWILLLGLWVLPLAQAPIPSLEFPEVFVPWSILALPLWVIGQLGISDRSSFKLHLGRLRLSASAALLVCWILLLAVVRLYGPVTETPVVPSPITELLAWIWGVAPVVLSLFAMWHVWRGTARPSVVANEQSSALG